MRRVYVPDVRKPELPSDKYNYWAVADEMLTTPPRPRQNYGLFGSSAGGSRPATAAAAAAEAPSTPGESDPYALSLSQEAPPEAWGVQGGQQAAQQGRQPGRAAGQSQIGFRSARARMAILQNAYKPPMAAPAPAPAPRGIFGSAASAASSSSSSTAAAATAAPAAPAPRARGAAAKEPAPGQRTITSFFTAQPAVAATGPSDMEMD